MASVFTSITYEIMIGNLYIIVSFLSFKFYFILC